MKNCRSTILSAVAPVLFGCASANGVTPSLPPAVHGYDSSQYTSNAPPATCPSPMTGSQDCTRNGPQPYPDCAANTANCVAIDALHNACNYFPDKSNPVCVCFKGQEDFCYPDGTNQLGVKKCQVTTNGTSTTYQWGPCTSPGTAP
jgi:hypothetical protein